MRGALPGVRPLHSRSPAQLVGQAHRLFNAERSCNRGRATVRLAAADRDRVLALGDDRLARSVTMLEVARLSKLNSHLLASPGIQMHALECPHRPQRRSHHVREAQVKLRHFVARHFAGVCHRHFDAITGSPAFTGSVGTPDRCS